MVNHVVNAVLHFGDSFAVTRQCILFFRQMTKSTTSLAMMRLSAMDIMANVGRSIVSFPLLATVRILRIYELPPFPI